MWVAGTRVLVNLIGFASTILLARLLMPADFGIVAIAVTVSALVTSTTQLSLASALIQHRDPQDHHFDTAWTMNALRSVVIAAVILVLSAPAARLYREPRLFEAMLAIAAMTVVAGLANPKLVLFTRKLIFWQEFAMGVSTKFAGFVVSIAIAFYYRNFWALIGGMAATELVALVMSYALLPYRPRFRLEGWRELLSFSIWLSLGQLVNTVSWKSDSLFVGYFLGPTKLGFYSYGDRLAQMPTQETTAPIAQTLFPAFARLTDDKPRLREAYQKSQALLTAIALPFGVGFAIIAEPMVLALIGEKWLPAVPVIQALSSVFALVTIGNAARPLAMAMAQTRMIFNRDVLGLSIRIPLLIIGALAAGLDGVIYGRVISGLIGIGINMAMVRRLIQLGFRAQLRANGRSLAAVAVMAAGLGAFQLGTSSSANIELSQFMLLLALIILGALLYTATLALLWVTAGRPVGPETIVVGAMAGIIARFGNGRDSNPTQT